MRNSIKFTALFIVLTLAAIPVLAQDGECGILNTWVPLEITSTAAEGLNYGLYTWAGSCGPTTSFGVRNTTGSYTVDVVASGYISPMKDGIVSSEAMLLGEEDVVFSYVYLDDMNQTINQVFVYNVKSSTVSYLALTDQANYMLVQCEIVSTNAVNMSISLNCTLLTDAQTYNVMFSYDRMALSWTLDGMVKQYSN